MAETRAGPIAEDLVREEDRRAREEGGEVRRVLAPMDSLRWPTSRTCVLVGDQWPGSPMSPTQSSPVRVRGWDSG
jgi:hypothetical protein